jgi:hypothetical protein
MIGLMGIAGVRLHAGKTGAAGTRRPSTTWHQHSNNHITVPSRRGDAVALNVPMIVRISKHSENFRPVVRILGPSQNIVRNSRAVVRNLQPFMQT